MCFMKKTHLKREDIKNNISDLVKIGWVTHNKCANVMYGINRDNKYVSELIEFFNDVGYVVSNENRILQKHLDH